MLRLKQNHYWNQAYKCSVSGDIIIAGELYYEDDEDGVIIKADVYHDMKRKQVEDNWDYSVINEAKSEAEYRRKLQEYSKQILSQSVLNRPLAGKDEVHQPEELEELSEVIEAVKRGEILK